MYKKISAFFLIAFSLIVMKTSPVLAQVNIWQGPDNFDTKGQIENSNLASTDPREMVANGIKIFLGFLGMIAVVLILYAGFLWMTSAGDDKKIESSKKILGASIVGLIIILMSYGLATFVLKQVVGVTTGSFN